MSRQVESAVKVITAVFGICLVSAPAFAIDCTKARTSVERAICADDRLGNEDDKLANAFAQILEYAKGAGFHRRNLNVESVRGDQTKWIAEREKACGPKAQDQLRDCISTWTTQRIAALTEASRLAKGDTLAVGAETLVVDVNEEGDKVLRYNGKVIAESFFPEFEPAFTILARASGPGGAGLLLEAGGAASLQCSTIYLVSTGKAGVQSRDLGLNCVGFDQVSTKKTDRGLTFMTPAAPYRDGEETDWDAQSGEISVHPIHFQPSAGTSMRDLISSSNAARQEPLKIQEFFDAVGKLPEADRKRLMVALWQIVEDCSSCIDDAGRDHYGVMIEPDGAVYSGCGVFMHGADLECGDTDALGVWEKKSGAFFFALSWHKKPEDPFPPAPAVSFPPVDQWSEYAKSKFQLWRSAAKWVKRDE